MQQLLSWFQSHQRLLGATLLVAGTSIGGAMLALPLVAHERHFLLTLSYFLLLWFYMLVGALCLLEVALIADDKSHLISIARRTLGPVGAVVSWGIYLLLLCSLLSAYLAVLSEMLYRTTFSWYPHEMVVDMTLVALFFAIIARRGVGTIDGWNRPLMMLMFALFLMLVGMLLPWTHMGHLSSAWQGYQHHQSMIVLTSFGFAIIVPSMCGYLNFDAKQLKLSIYWGSLLPLIAYLLWCAATLGVLGQWSDTSVKTVSDLIQALSVATDSTMLVGCAMIFSALCVVTSLLGVSLSLMDCLKDGLRRVGRCFRWPDRYGGLLIFLPALLVNVWSPSWFLWGLHYAGLCCVLLLAFLPALMAWRSRYVLCEARCYQVPGGRMVLLGQMLLSMHWLLGAFSG